MLQNYNNKNYNQSNNSVKISFTIDFKTSEKVHDYTQTNLVSHGYSILFLETKGEMLLLRRIVVYTFTLYLCKQ